jgi:hypothetical protein
MSVQETTYYDKAGVKITNARAIMGTNTYPMTNITSVGIGTIPASNTGFLLLVIVGLGLIACPLASSRVWTDSLIFIIAGALALVGAVVLYRGRRDTYVVKLGAAGGEQRAYTSADRAEIESIVAALNDAIVRRG